MDVSLFDYELPPELIAQEPLAERTASRMLVMARQGALALANRQFSDLPEYLQPGDCLVVNDTRVIPARLLGHRASGGKAEVLLLREVEPDVWEALVRPGARLRPGAWVTVGEDELALEILEMAPGGRRLVRLEHAAPLEEVLERLGQVPLPPYIHREQPSEGDRERYQTVYAEKAGAVAAPTAGLHFDDRVLAELERRGVRTATVTLHVGLGTFQPIKVDRVEDHEMHEEWYEVPAETARAISEAHAAGRRVLAVGTTTVRALESQAGPGGEPRAGSGLTRLFITPGYKFEVVDALLTNFHLPRSTLLMMVSAFAGRERALEAYRHAVEARYRFFSYGDCMLVQ
jgi:S-adenosylmethionine:tRNA ribosyltransferase-isomerase